MIVNCKVPKHFNLTDHLMLHFSEILLCSLCIQESGILFSVNFVFLMSFVLIPNIHCVKKTHRKK